MKIPISEAGRSRNVNHLDNPITKVDTFESEYIRRYDFLYANFITYNCNKKIVVNRLMSGVNVFNIDQTDFYIIVLPLTVQSIEEVKFKPNIEPGWPYKENSAQPKEVKKVNGLNVEIIIEDLETTKSKENITKTLL